MQRDPTKKLLNSTGTVLLCVACSLGFRSFDGLLLHTALLSYLHNILPSVIIPLVEQAVGEAKGACGHFSVCV